MDKSKLEYDSENQILTYRSGLSGETLLPKDTGRQLSGIGRAGEHDGEPVSGVRVTFDDDAAAEYNADALKFLGLETLGPSGHVASSAEFSKREDFGLD